MRVFQELAFDINMMSQGMVAGSVPFSVESEAALSPSCAAFKLFIAGQPGGLPVTKSCLPVGPQHMPQRPGAQLVYRLAANTMSRLIMADAC